LAQWQLGGLPVCTEVGNQNGHAIVSDGGSGVIIVWVDARYGISDTDIYAQRVSADGAAQWSAGGVFVCGAQGNQVAPQVVSDGAGGVIVTWKDRRAGDDDIYAQRVNASGNPLWTANGVALCALGYEEGDPVIVSDGAGGAIVAWPDRRYGPADIDIFAQRVNAAGATQWTVNGISVCAATGNQDAPRMTLDGSGGAIVAWHDHRGGYDDIYVQRVAAWGVPQWTSNGVALCTFTENQYLPFIASDGSGGAIVTWTDNRNGPGQADIYARRVNASGVAQWTPDGVALCAASGDQWKTAIASDGAGGAIVTWQDNRNGAGQADIYAQRVSVSGAPQWNADGAVVREGGGNNNMFSPAIVADGAGGAIVVWEHSGADRSVYAQRMNSLGATQWAVNGAQISAASSFPLVPALISTGVEAIVVWSDGRSGSDDIYAERAELRYGEWGQPEPKIISLADNPSDQGGKVILRWEKSDRDRHNDALIAQYSIWRSTDFVSASAALSAVDGAHLVASPAVIGVQVSGPTIWKEMTPTGPEYWEWIANQNATYQSTYSITAPTRHDSVATNTATHYFKVLAHESTLPQSRVWESATASGHSVDNLAPASPASPAAGRVGNDVALHWNRVQVSDLRDYAIYRSTSPGLSPQPEYFLAFSEDTLFVDQNVPTSALYYVVTAYDVHANQSGPSSEISVGATTGIGNTPALTALTVLQNHPNPFSATTDFEIGLPKSSDVSVEVFDVAGRKVSTLHVAGVKGWQRVAFSARDESGRSLASGVYFYRVKAAGATVTNKMVITR
jgi:hypothetical protein